MRGYNSYIILHGPNISDNLISNSANISYLPWTFMMLLCIERLMPQYRWGVLHHLHATYLWSLHCMQSSQRRVPLSLIVYGRYRWNMVSDSLESTSWWTIHLCQKSVLSQIAFPRSNHTETSSNTKPSSSTFDRSHKHSLLCYLQPKHVYFKFGTKKPFLWTRILEHYSGILILTAFIASKFMIVIVHSSALCLKTDRTGLFQWKPP